MASPSPPFMFETDPASNQRDGRASSAGSSDFGELGDAQVQQLPAIHKEMPHLDLNTPSTADAASQSDNTPSLSYQGVLSPRQQSGKRYHGGYLQHRVSKAAGLLKSWKRKYFRLREHGLVCYKTQDAATPLFEVNFTSQSVLTQDKIHGEQTTNSSCTPKQRHSPKAGDACTDPSEKRRRTWTSSSSGQLTLILKNFEITGHQTPAKAVELPLFLKAEDEADHAAWTECIHFMIEARKRALIQATVGDGDTDEISLPAQSQPSDHTMSADSTDTGNSLEKVKTFEAFSAKYMLMKEIGEGSFSIVHRAVNRMTGHVCAVKCCKISQALEEEERLLRTLSHPNVWRTVSPLAQDALLKMLKTNDTERISAEDLLSHPWFNDVDVTSSAEELERARIEDCEALGLAELLSRGFQVVKYGYKKATTPHSTSLTINFMEESVTWTARKNAMLENAPGSSKRGRAIPLREIKEIREGHATEAFLSHKESKSVPPPELCLSIICPWRTLDLVVEVPSQREFLVRGLRRLLPISSQ
ncbi:hypothetical protein PC111_g13192 [Phytophthora cactorum]|nr:hypothetical protein PC111_g13192 [Phytophthora cactorum]KAG2895712.1 hypothetical protein PC114_g15391 [Phytophthora cactorum]KAG3152966.1 hypothetical protein C6341_g16122 [Phytophthora cactorum]